MLRHARRRPGYGLQLCAAASALILILFSLSVLHSRLSSSPSFPLRLGLPSVLPRRTHVDPVPDHDTALFEDDDIDPLNETDPGEDRIDELDVVEEEVERGGSAQVEEEDSDEQDTDETSVQDIPRSGLFWDHGLGVARRRFGPADQDWQRKRFPSSYGACPFRSKISFASDDQPVDEDMRIKLDSIRKVEDALLLKTGSGESPLRDGWARWLEGKGNFLRRERMLRSNLELLNPRNHPLLQDPDGPGLTTLTQGDRLIQRTLLREMERTPLTLRKGDDAKRSERRRTLVVEKQEEISNGHLQKHTQEGRMHTHDRRWGYFPGLDPHLTFSEFMEQFLGSGQCGITVFMVWNSPQWTYGPRHRLGLESLLHHHWDACVVVFSETMELGFFRDLVKEGYRVAVAMPNLEELLEDTEARVFSSAFFDWRKTKYYSVHYSELVRLAVLFKYGGIYLDSDIVVLKPLHLLKNLVSIESNTSGSTVFNGAVMAFEKNSSLMLECLKELVATYHDNLLRWNGAELMTRVINRVSDKTDKFDMQMEPQFIFHPISSTNITRYFAEPSGEFERVEEDALLNKIVNESTTFHFWNGLTFALVPKPNSLVERLLNQYSLHCHGLL
ncbi:uncharacterized protein At4g19900-like [Zingiber officinale]|uniref:uncharacterized protein At4g19900-like n=1 Tax=Zingiber officinale TaxID=94328 RepID=UPI001C4A9F22|nr:uncharacterized protein At4g19900-like [Zingiber officinale]